MRHHRQLSGHAGASCAAALDQDQSLAPDRQSVQLAQQARRDYLAEHPQAAPLLIAGSVGPYGAYLADGSEYRGDYRLAQDDMMAFHARASPPWRPLASSLLACETLPSFANCRRC